MMKKTVKIMNTNLALIMSIGAGVGIGVVFTALILGVARNSSDPLLVHIILGFAFAEATELVIAGLNIGIGVMVGMLTLILKFYIFSIGIFIPCYLIYSILLKFINIFHKYPHMFKFVLSIFIILLLLFCWISYSFSAFILLFQVLYLSFICIPISSHLYTNFILFKLEYPNLYKILYKFIFYLFIILLTIFLLFLYFNIIAEVPVEFLENKTIYGNFVAFSPTESNTVEQNPLLNLKNQFMKSYARFLNMYAIQQAEMYKLNNTTKLLGIECQFDIIPHGAEGHSSDYFSILSEECETKVGVYVFAFEDNLSDESIKEVHDKVRTNVIRIKGASKISSSNLVELRALDDERATYVGYREHPEEYYNRLSSYFTQCESLLGVFKASEKSLTIIHKPVTT